jgi:hypothetical protein
MTVCQTRRLLGLAMVLWCGLATIAGAEVRLEGSLAAVQITTKQGTISDVLSALATRFNVKYRTAIALDATAYATYKGSFEHVVSRLLVGYNYMIITDQGSTEIIVLGKVGEAVIAPQAKSPEGILSRWR